MVSKISTSILILLMAASGSLQAAEKSPSILDRWLHKIVRPVSALRFAMTAFNESRTVHAPEEYQKMAQEAQAAHGIPLQEHVPIKIIPERFAGSEAAMAGPRGVYINESNLNWQSYGRRRVILFHEYAHIKNYDSTFIERSLLKLLIFLGAIKFKGTFMLKCLGKFLPKAIINFIQKDPYMVLLGLAGAATVWDNLTGEHPETRADRQGIKASGCYQCVNEFAQSCPKYDYSRWRGGPPDPYLLHDKVKELAGNLEKEKRLCRQHFLLRAN